MSDEAKPPRPDINDLLKIARALGEADPDARIVLVYVQRTGELMVAGNCALATSRNVCRHAIGVIEGRQVNDHPTIQ